MTEEILGFIHCTVINENDYFCHLYFTPNRAIVAKTGSTGFGYDSDDKFGGGILGPFIAPSLAKGKSLLYENLSPEDILNSNKKNFEIPYTEITKVEWKETPGSDFSFWSIFAERGINILIFTHTKNYWFFIKEEEFDEHGKLLRSVLPDNLFIHLQNIDGSYFSKMNKML
jgi:hypothetical protein